MGPAYGQQHHILPFYRLHIGMVVNFVGEVVESDSEF